MTVSNNRLLCLSLLTCLPIASLRGEEPPAYPDRSQVMVYRDEQNREHPVRNADDWAIRRRHILLGMQQAMGSLPDRENLPPLDVEVLDRVAEDGYERLTIAFTAEGTDRVPAYLLLPNQRTDRAPAMLCLHQTTNVGKGEVCGMGGNPNLHYAKELAQRGYVVLAPDYPSFGDYPYDFNADDYVSGTMKGIFNHMRCVDLLSTRDEVDAERIGVIGHSLGGHNALFVAAFDERLKVVVSSCGWTPFHDYYEGNIAGWTGDRYMPRLRDEYGLDADRLPFDFYEVVAALAPRAFFSCSPLRDSNFAVAGVEKAMPVAAEVYRLLGAEDALSARYPDSEHDFPPETRREAYEFIDRVLRHER